MTTEPGCQVIVGRRHRADGEAVALTDPSSQETIVAVDLAGPAEVDAAVAAARRAFAHWSSTTPAERSTLMHAWARLLEERSSELALTETRQAGKPIRLSTEFDVPGTVDNTAFFAGQARSLEGKASGEYSPDHTSIIRRP